ncbi:MAG: NUDIX domain-containing protein, partial [Patescibacteria group bacterium]
MNSDPNARPQIILVNRCFVLDDENKILLIKRVSNDSHHPSLWECPGGKLDQGQDIMRAREREVMEETGLLVNLIHPLVYADSYIVGDGKYAGMPYIGLFGIARSLGGKLTLSSEHSDFVWVTHDEALSYELTPEVRKAMIILK